MPCACSRETGSPSSANSPPKGAGTIAGRLWAIDVDSCMLLLRLGLEVGARFDPHIGGMNINEDTVIIKRYFTSSSGPGPPKLSWQPWELLLPPFLSQLWCRAVGAGLQGCRVGCAWGPSMAPLHRTVAGHTWILKVVFLWSSMVCQSLGAPSPPAAASPHWAQGPV